MNKELSSNEIKEILLKSDRFTILCDSINYYTSLKNLRSTIRKSSTNSIIIEIINNKLYYIYDSHNNVWIETNNISGYRFEIPYSYNYGLDEKFTLTYYL